MAKVSFPARCAVAVVCGEHLISQVYPASVPVEVFIDNIVELLNDELKRRGLSGLEIGQSDTNCTRPTACGWTSPRTLDELGVEDGATLVLVPAVGGDSFEPQYESSVHRPGPRRQETVRARHGRYRRAHGVGDPGDGRRRRSSAWRCVAAFRHRRAGAEHGDRCHRLAGRRCCAPSVWRWWPHRD